MEALTVLSQHQIEPYRGSLEILKQIAMPFTGSPRNSPSPGKVLLLSDPASTHAFYYEFRGQDILYAEEAPNLSLSDGSTVAMIRLWVKKGVTALRIVPFHVQDTTLGLRDFFDD